MEKLELKHLAPYLPYGLKVYYKHKNKLLQLTGLGFQQEGESYVFNTWCAGLDDLDLKPILRPMSDLMNTIIIKNKEVTPYLWWDDEKRQQDLFLCSKDYEYVEYLEYFIVELLLEWHFDVFGLIEKGLAIDVNKLAQLK